MLRRSATWLLWSPVLLLVLGCGSGGEPAKGTPPVALPIGATPSTKQTAGVCAEGTSWNGKACVGESCPGGSIADAYGGCVVPLSTAERAALAAAIAHQDQLIDAAQFKDADALAERSRLQLVRDDPSGAGGNSDDAGALLDAQRAIAVDEEAAPGRVALALATARSLLEPAAKASPGPRGVTLGLVFYVGRWAAGGAQGAPEAAARTLVGFALLDLGDAMAARKEFEAALNAETRVHAAWIGLGDAHRAAAQFDEAAAAYEKALSSAPGSFDAKRALDSAKRKVRLILPAQPDLPPGMPTLGSGLAGPAPRPTACPASAPKATAALCQAVAGLVGAQSPKQQENAAGDIIREFKALGCSNAGSACGPHVGQALLDASRGFAAANVLGKAIATARFLLQEQAFAALHSDAELEIADDYFRLAIFAEAANWYEKLADLTPSASLRASARERALLLRAALGKSHAVTELAEAVARDTSQPVAKRAALLWIAAMMQPSQEARAMLERHRQLMEDGGLGARVSEAQAHPAQTALALARGVRLLAADPLWSPGAGK